jgi:hypothetical protein
MFHSLQSRSPSSDILLCNPATPLALADHITPMGRPHRVLSEARSATRSKLEGSK